MKKILLILLISLFLVGLARFSSNAAYIKKKTQKAGDAIEQKITESEEIIKEGEKIFENTKNKVSESLEKIKNSFK